MLLFELVIVQDGCVLIEIILVVLCMFIWDIVDEVYGEVVDVVGGCLYGDLFEVLLCLGSVVVDEGVVYYDVCLCGQLVCMVEVVVSVGLGYDIWLCVVEMLCKCYWLECKLLLISILFQVVILVLVVWLVWLGIGVVVCYVNLVVWKLVSSWLDLLVLLDFVQEVLCELWLVVQVYNVLLQ